MLSVAVRTLQVPSADIIRPVGLRDEMAQECGFREVEAYGTNVAIYLLKTSYLSRGEPP
jgi:hypothetical protein